MVKRGPPSRNTEIMFEILKLLSKKPHGVRELHRALPREHHAGSFTTLYDCINLLKSEGHIETDPETKKLRITPEGNLEREKQFVITEIIRSKMIAGCTSPSSASPIRYEWSLIKNCGDAKQQYNRLPTILQTNPLEANLFFLSGFIWSIFESVENKELVDQKLTVDTVLDKLCSELPPDMEVLNIVAIDVKRLLTWLKTPSGAPLLEYVLEQKHSGKIKEIATLAGSSCTTTTTAQF